MADKDNDEKKIIIDEDWKAQAQKEKEDLVKEAEAKKDTKEKQAHAQKQLPAADFSGLVNMLTTQAFFALGLIRTEEDKEQPADLQSAKYNIDMLEVIEQKSKGNLTEEEEKLLSGALHQLRMAFVKISQ
jgi:hypothetical protein